MRKSIIGMIAAASLGLTGLISPAAFAEPAEPAPVAPGEIAGAPVFVPHSSNPRLAKWQDLQFGLFMHWGVYSMFEGSFKGEAQGIGYPEQIKAWMKISDADYLAEAQKMTAEKFDAGAICQMAKDTGMKYVMITSKHHDGFAMWDTKTTDYNVVKKTAFGRDPMKELQLACAERDIKLAFYFSIIDWTKHEAEPYSNLNRIPESMMPYIKEQITELMTNYGPIAEFWFDMGKPTADQSERMANWVRELQPETTVVNSRVWNDKGDFEVGGDNAVSEQFHHGPWESILSIFPQCWSYCSTYKANRDESTIKTKAIWALDGLIKVISGGGQYAFNIGPKGDGSIDPYDRAVLAKIGEWMKRHPDAITGAHATYFPIQRSVRVTTKDNALYLFPTRWDDGVTLTIPGLTNRVTKVTVDGADTELPFTRDGLDLTVTLRGEEPDELQGVVKVEVEGTPGMLPTATAELKNGQASVSQDGIVGLMSPKRYGGNSAYDAYFYARSGKVFGDVTLTYDFRSRPNPGTTYKITYGDQSFTVTGSELASGPVGQGLTLEPNVVKRVRIEYANPDYYARPLDLRPSGLTIQASETPGANLAPVFTTQPEDVSVEVGQSATFTAHAKARPAATYQWFKKAPGSESFEPIADETRPMLTLANVTLNDSGTKVYVEARNDAGTVRSSEVTLTVEKPSNNLALRKVASQSSTGWGGTADRAVDGNTDGVWDHNSVTHTNESANGSWWQVNLGDAVPVGQVKVWNRAAETTCSRVPSCDHRLKDFYVVASATAVGHTADIEAIRAMENVKVIKVEGVGGRPSTVDFEGFEAQFVRVIQPTRQPLSLAEVEVFAAEEQMLPPTVSAIEFRTSADNVQAAGDGSFRTITAPAGTEFILSVDVTGDPEPTVVWYKRPNPTAEWEELDVDDTTMTVVTSSQENGAQYRVLVRNEAGEAQSGVVQFDVTNPGGDTPDVVAPTVTTQPASVTVKEGTPARFTVEVNSTAEVTYQWFKKASAAQEGEAVLGAVEATLTVENPTLADSGSIYYVEATNRAGMVRSEEATLTVLKNRENLALKKNATQSSTGWGGVPGRAVDGNTDGMWDNNSVSHTRESSTGSWWQVDLGAAAKLGEVNVWNRAKETTCAGIDSCDMRLRDFYVVASAADLGAATDIEAIRAMENVKVIKVEGVGGHPSTVDFEGFEAQFVRVIQPTRQPLTLAEVEVFAAEVAKVAPTIQGFTFTTESTSVETGGDDAHRILTAPAPTSYVLSVQTSGTPEPTLTWFTRNGNDAEWTALDEHSATLPVTITADDSGKQYRVVATNEAGEATSDIIEFKVATPPAPPAPEKKLNLSKPAPVLGDSVTFEVSGLEPGTSVVFEVHSEPLVLGPVLADSSGVARFTWKIPTDFEVGKHTVHALFAGKTVTMPFEIAKPASPPQTDPPKDPTPGKDNTAPKTDTQPKVDGPNAGKPLPKGTDKGTHKAGIAKKPSTTGTVRSGLAHTGAETQSLMMLSSVMVAAGLHISLRRRHSR